MSSRSGAEELGTSAGILEPGCCPATAVDEAKIFPLTPQQRAELIELKHEALYLNESLELHKRLFVEAWGSLQEMAAQNKDLLKEEKALKETIDLFESLPTADGDRDTDCTEQAAPHTDISSLSPGEQPPAKAPVPHLSGPALPQSPLAVELPLPAFFASAAGLSVPEPQRSGSTSELHDPGSATRAQQQGHGSGRTPRPLPPSATMLVVRNIPSYYDQERLLEEWPADGTFDLLHLPFSASEQRFKGFVFINFKTHAQALDFQRKWHGMHLQHRGGKALDVAVGTVQGAKNYLERFRGKDVSRLNKRGHLPALFRGRRRSNPVQVLRRLHIA